MALYRKHTDSELFNLVAQSVEAAFSEIFRRYDKRIYPFVLKMIKTESVAEELTQEIFIKLWFNRQKLNDVSNPSSYLFGIAANHTLDHIRKKLNERRMLNHLSEKLKGDSSNNTEESMLLRDCEALIAKALIDLPPQQKKIYVLSRQHGLKNEEIASQMSLSPNTVRNHLSEALKSIRTYMEKKGQVYISLLILLLQAKENIF
jgi:RNA polymerase sigma-70 factor (family 1)